MSESLAFRGLRYARAERFGPAEMVPLRDVVPDQGRGPVPPQTPSRFDILMGRPARLAQSEHCQVLSVFTPSRSGKRPVLVWFHGGASITGGGELPWYDGHRLAVEQDVVVVTVTARLGALGHLLLDGADHPSPATTDHMAAVDWVHQHIDQFGGDPDNITLFGQSAGGFAIDVLLRWGVGSHVKGAIVQSGFLSQDDIVYRHDDIKRLAEDFTTVLAGNPRSATVTELLTAQAELARRAGRAEIWAPVRPGRSQKVQIPVIVGRTRHDALPFLLIKGGVSLPDRRHSDLLAPEMEREHAEQIDKGNKEFARRAMANGKRAWLYELAWEAPASGWRACHCVDLPLLLGDRHAWAQAPMLRGADWDLLERQGRYLRAAWASFARDGSPGQDWIPFDPAQCDVKVIEGDLPAV